MGSSYDIYDPTHSRNSIASMPSVSQPDYPTSDQSRILPRQLSTGSLRGTQNVGYGDTKIDGSNNVIRVGNGILLDGTNDIIDVVTNSSGSVSLGAITTNGVPAGFGLVAKNTDGSTVGMGTIPGTVDEFGFFATDSDGTLIFKIVNGTMYMYDGESGINTLQLGKLTNGTTNLVIAKPGTPVSDVIGT